MSSLANYRKTGRVALATWAWYNFAQSVSERSIIGTTAWGLTATEATIGVFFPDPIATAVGYGVTKATSKVLSSWWRLNNAYWGMSVAKRSAVGWVLFTPFVILEKQARAAGYYEETPAQLGTGEALGEAMWKAQSIPNTERLDVRVSTFGGGVPF